MDFRLQTSKKSKNASSVNVPKETLDNVIKILDKVDCTCVWSDRHNEYFKVFDVDQKIVEELKTAVALSSLTNV